MSLELPGYYFDESKNRYFPLSSKPKPKTESSEQTDTPSRNRIKRRRRDATWSTSERLRTGTIYSHRQRDMHEIMCTQIMSTTRVTRATVPALAYGAITSFCTTSFNDQTHSFLGDTRGWLYSLCAPEDAWISSSSSADFLQTRRWIPELNLASGISSIRMSGSRCVATSFGPSCKILVQDMSSTETYILNPGERVVHDVWTSHLQDRSLVIGANGKAIYLQDIDTARSLKMLSTYSDVFAVHQQENLVYTGTRSGIISRFDMRMDKLDGQGVLEGRGHASNTSVTHLDIVHGWKLLVAQMDGTLEAFDLRFARADTPLMTFTGHFNSYLPRLPVTVDPSQDFVFAAGQDRRIRAWSLRTGHPLLVGEQPRDLPSGFAWQFDTTVQALQVTEEKDGPCLWAASDEALHKYHLGQRACS